MHKSVHKYSVPDSHTLLLFIVKSYYLNVLFSCQICMYICMYVCLANKANSDSDSDLKTPLLLFSTLFDYDVSSPVPSWDRKVSIRCTLQNLG